MSLYPNYHSLGFDFRRRILGLRPATLAVVSLGFAMLLRAEYSPELLERIDRPLEAEAIDLSADGRYVAYSSRIGDKSGVVIVDLQEKVRRQLSMTAGTNEARIVELRWATPDRLVIQSANGDIFAADATGANAIQIWDGARIGNTREYQWNTRAGFPTMIPVSGDSNHVWVETREEGPMEPWMGGKNLYIVDVSNGESRLAWTKFRASNQDFLYVEGDMLYDRSGQPRLYYWRPLATQVRRFRYVAPDKAPWYWASDRPIDGLGIGTINANPPATLDQFLGQQNKDEFTISTENYFGERSFPLAFGWDPNVFYFASNVGRDTYAIYSLNLESRERTEVAALEDVDLAGFEPAFPDRRLIFDESRKTLAGVPYKDLEARTLWLDRELDQTQQALDKLFPGQNVIIRDWDDSRSIYLLHLAATGQPGGYALWRPTDGSLEVLTPAAPWLAAGDLSRTETFEFETEDGVRLTGYLTWPNESKVTPPSLLVYAAGGLWDRSDPGFNREVQVLAAMGVAILQVKYRGTAGFGREHLQAIKSGLEAIPIADIVSAVQWAVASQGFNSSRVVILGEHFGGYIALRALEQRPDLFRGAMLLNAPTNLDSWSSGRVLPNPMFEPGVISPDSYVLQRLNMPRMPMEFESLVRARFVSGAERLTQAASLPDAGLPVLIFEDPSNSDVTSGSTLLGQIGLGFRWAEIRRIGITGDLVDGTAETRERVFEEINAFLNSNLYDPNVQIGPLRVIPDETEPVRETPFE